MKTLTSLALCLVFGSVLVSAQTILTNDDADQLIARVKTTLASQIDPALPPVTFEKWLLRQGGGDATIGWAVRSADRPGHGLPWVEVDVSIGSRPGLVIMIACGTSQGGIATRPKFHSLELVRELVRPDEYAEWPRLRDLPTALQRVRGGAK